MIDRTVGVDYAGECAIGAGQGGNSREGCDCILCDWCPNCRGEGEQGEEEGRHPGGGVGGVERVSRDKEILILN